MAEIKASLDDMVFKNRNKAYGAYALRKMLTKNTFRALFVAATVISLLVLIPILNNLLAAEEELVEEPTIREVELLEPPPLEEEDQPEPPPEVEPPPPPKRSQVKYVPPEVVDTEEADTETEIVDLDTVKTDIGTSNIEGDDDAPLEIGDLDEFGDGDAPVELREPVNTIPDDQGFVAYSKQPSPVNLEEIQKQIEYPQQAKDAEIQGTVTFRIYFDENGRYVKHKLMNSPHPFLTKEAVKHLAKVRVSPALMGDKAVGSWVTIPIRFRLD